MYKHISSQELRDRTTFPSFWM